MPATIEIAVHGRWDAIALLKRLNPQSSQTQNSLPTSGCRVADASVEFAKAGTDPDPADALKHVYAVER